MNRLDQRRPVKNLIIVISKRPLSFLRQSLYLRAAAAKLAIRDRDVL
jgi:hypothetical protein